MANLWEDIKKFVKDGATAAADRFEEETTLWKIHREISNLKKSVDAQKTQLGAHVYEILKTTPETNFVEDEKTNALVAEIDKLLEQVAEKQDEYDEFKKATEEKRAQEATEKPPTAEVVTETPPPPPAEPEPEKPKKTKRKAPKDPEPPAEAEK